MPVNIVDLLPELLEEIFRHLPKANDRRRLALVCRTFYNIIRGQSKKFNTLYLTKTVPDNSPVQVFKNSTTFPFSKLLVHDRSCNGVSSIEPIATRPPMWPIVPDVGHDALDILGDRDFWLEHGEHITELTIFGPFFFRWLSFFPCLRKLKLYSELMITENAPKIQLPIEELCIDMHMKPICYILQCCPSLKSVELSMGRDHFKRLAELLPWIESIETVKVDVEVGVELKDTLELPSKVVLQYLQISPATNVEIIASFFNKPRLIETLCWNLIPRYDNAPNFRFSKDKVLPLLNAESIKKMELIYYPYFPKSFDLLAQVPGLQEISISCDSQIALPRYWSNPNTANKIHKIGFRSDLNPEVLTGLSSLSCLTIKSLNGNLEVLRNHRKLKKLVIQTFYYRDAGLDPISSLHDLEILVLNYAPNITIDAFKTTIKFPKLKKLVIQSGVMENDFAMLLPENCPNLEQLELVYLQYNYDLWMGRMSVGHMKQKEAITGQLDDAGFEHLIRALPCLKAIKIDGKRHTVSEEKVQQMQMEFPYLKINVSQGYDISGAQAEMFKYSGNSGRISEP